MTPSAAKKKREQWRIIKKRQRERLRQINQVMEDTPESFNESALEDPQFEPQSSEPNEPETPSSKSSEPNAPTTHTTQSSEQNAPTTHTFQSIEPQENTEPLASSTPERKDNNTLKRLARLKKEKAKLKDEVVQLQRQLAQANKEKEQNKETSQNGQQNKRFQ